MSIGANGPKEKKKTMEGEAIMICIDTSSWMKSHESTRFKDQADAIELYCTEKFKSHPETVVGICGMGQRCMTHLCRPTRAIPRIMRAVYEATIAGELLLIEAVMDAHDVWFGCRGKELGKHLPKRIAVFAGGPVYEEMGDLQILGQAMKDKNVACDAISFGDPGVDKKEVFETLISFAETNGNCNLLHVPPGVSVYDALSRSQIIRSGSAPLASLPVQPESSKQNIDALSRSQIIRTGSVPLASLRVQQESSSQNINALSRSQIIRSGSVPLASLPLQQQDSSKKNIMAAALYSVADNTDALALSRSRIIPHAGVSGPLASLSVQQESSKLDKKFAANFSECVDPRDHPAKINALSQSVVDLKLDNLKPNSQPETLDQSIERVKRELESLTAQKNKQKNNQKKKNKQKNKQVAC